MTLIFLIFEYLFAVKKTNIVTDLIEAQIIETNNRNFFLIIELSSNELSNNRNLTCNS